MFERSLDAPSVTGQKNRARIEIQPVLNPISYEKP
jgi:hypothetical protein